MKAPPPVDQPDTRLFASWFRVLVVALAAGCVIGLMYGVEGIIAYGPKGSGLTGLLVPLARQLVPVCLWAVLGWLALMVLDWVDVGGWSAARLTAGHLLLAMLLALIHMSTMALVERLSGLYGISGTFDEIFSLLLWQRFTSDLLYYSPVAAVYHMAAYLRALRQNHASVAVAQQRKVEATRHLAGSIAHVLNNSLCSVRLNLELALDALRSHPARVEVEAARNACGPLDGLEASLKALGQIMEIQPKREELLPLLERITRMLSQETGVAARLRATGPAGAEECLVDELRLGSALRDVIREGLQPGGGGASISVTYRGRSEPEPARPPWPATLEDSHQIDVAITGLIEPGVVESDLDPRFEESGAAVGARLGLSILDATMTQMGGAVTVESTERSIVLHLHLASWNGVGALPGVS